ncbi:hypothetical protein DSCA_21730 [Desulfosarcina alkanivorans]|uniref:Uncharacterized protein n=1 Tax=Desulfosarcina alkanivorans TaxID=571177 RepID=A0A5K7YI59_9BACT|nr:hypothetical protein DSCA_21730 [Desulfosarcina alkanivorans]
MCEVHLNPNPPPVQMNSSISGIGSVDGGRAAGAGSRRDTARFDMRRPPLMHFLFRSRSAAGGADIQIDMGAAFFIQFG